MFLPLTWIWISGGESDIVVFSEGKRRRAKEKMHKGMTNWLELMITVAGLSPHIDESAPPLPNHRSHRWAAP